MNTTHIYKILCTKHIFTTQLIGKVLKFRWRLHDASWSDSNAKRRLNCFIRFGYVLRLWCAPISVSVVFYWAAVCLKCLRFRLKLQPSFVLTVWDLLIRSDIPFPVIQFFPFCVTSFLPDLSGRSSLPACRSKLSFYLPFLVSMRILMSLEVVAADKRKEAVSRST